jgi:hypothetical protein
MNVFCDDFKTDTYETRMCTEHHVVQDAILESADTIGRVVSPDSRSVLSLIEQAPADAGPIILRLISGMLSRTAGIPPPPLVDSVLGHYEKTASLDLLALILPGMPTAQALKYAGELVKMPVEAFREAVRRLVSRPEGAGQPPVSPHALLMHYHLLDYREGGVRCCLSL